LLVKDESSAEGLTQSQSKQISTNMPWLSGKRRGCKQKQGISWHNLEVNKFRCKKR
jgi:hypothetical protein